RQNIHSHPTNNETYILLGNILSDIDLIDAAIACYKTAIFYNSVNCVGYNNLAIAYKDNHEIEMSIENFLTALSLCPQDPFIHWNLALTLLLKGDYVAGFREYEWRWLKSDYKMYERTYPFKEWDGSWDVGSILIYAEQGLGDTIHFSRYSEILASKGINVTIHCHSELVRLMRHVNGVSSSLPFEETPDDRDCYYPMMSLPFMCKTDKETIPRNIPFIRPDDNDVMRWTEVVNSYGDGLKVGIAWAGSPRHPNDKKRSIPFESILPLLEVKGVKFFNLQIGHTKGHESQYLIDLSQGISDFYDTSCLIKSLDLLITADTAVCHLAGAMGKDVWVMLPYSPDWRWGLEVPTSDWYPTARLFRQSQRGDWHGVVREIKKGLEKKL
ncbi:MAG: hypothetical protein SNJ53_03295, partial [Thermodesulfovibrionales bacterium]